MFTICSSFAEDYKFELLKNYEQNKESGLFIRDNNTLYGDDFSAENIIIDEKGNLYIYQNETFRMIFLDKRFSIQKQMKLNLSNEAFSIKCNKNVFFITNSFGTINSINDNGEKKFHCSMFDINGTSAKTSFYYDEETNILFLQDKNEQLYSIINPGLDEEQNKKNFKTPEETLAMLNEGKYAPHLEIREELNWQKKAKNYLYIDGKRERWGNAYEIGRYICSVIPEDNYINLYDGKTRVEAHYELPNGEQLESNAFHPCGDAYFLTMNWTTNTHNLYRIENTWDPEWRKEWYENHETENVSQNILSINVTVNKEMTCSDNLRLRSEEATSSRVITTMQKGTKVKILKLGKAETIDGISSNWVQVEVLSGAKDKDGNALKAGTIGWCYGGYLE